MTGNDARVADRIREKLAAAFAPEALEVSTKARSTAATAAGAKGGETHFRVAMRAAAFDGMSRVERSRAVHAALGEELRGPVHALALELRGRAG
jgi:BolA protein